MTVTRNHRSTVVGTTVAPRAPVNRPTNRLTGARITGNEPWRDKAECMNRDPELWFMDKAVERRDAMRICRTVCPVMAECRAWAMVTKQRYGVWGGLDFQAEVPPWLDAGKPPRARAVVQGVEKMLREGREAPYIAEKLGYQGKTPVDSLCRALYRFHRKDLAHLLRGTK